MLHSLKIKLNSNFILTCATLLGLSGCATSYSGSNTSQANQIFDPAKYDAERVSVQYKPEIREKTFSIGDEATVTVNGFDEFSGIYTVGNDGNIFLGHIGNVQAAGKTIPELQTLLTKEYGSCCLVNPNISLEREEGQVFGRIVVDGAVNDAGVFDVEEVIKLSEAIALAGGISEFGKPEMTILSREINGERRISQVNLVAIQRYGANDPLIYPSDIVFVQDSKGKLFYKDFVKTIPVISALILASTR